MQRSGELGLADLPRPEASRHPQHRRQGGPGAARRSSPPSSPFMPPAGGRCWRPPRPPPPPGHEGRRCDRADQPRPATISRSIGVRGDAGASRSSGWRELARAAGLDGIVCSGAEVGGRARSLARRLFRRSRGSPGRRRSSPTRSAWSPRAQAIDDGASILVIGRPITGAADPARRSATSPRRCRLDNRHRRA